MEHNNDMEHNTESGIGQSKCAVGVDIMDKRFCDLPSEKVKVNGREYDSWVVYVWYIGNYVRFMDIADKDNVGDDSPDEVDSIVQFVDPKKRVSDAIGENYNDIKDLMNRQPKKSEIHKMKSELQKIAEVYDESVGRANERKFLSDSFRKGCVVVNDGLNSLMQMFASPEFPMESPKFDEALNSLFTAKMHAKRLYEISKEL